MVSIKIVKFSVTWSPKSAWTPWWSITWSLFVNTVHQTLCLARLGEHCSRTLAKCSRALLTTKCNKGVWWTLFTNFGKLSTNNVHQKVQKEGLVNLVHELWQTIREQCSRESAKKGVWWTMFTNFGTTTNVHQKARKRDCSWIVRVQGHCPWTICQKGFVNIIQKIKIENSHKYQHWKLTRGSRIYSNQSPFLKTFTS